MFEGDFADIYTEIILLVSIGGRGTPKKHAQTGSEGPNWHEQEFQSNLSPKIISPRMISKDPTSFLHVDSRTIFNQTES